MGAGIVGSSIAREILLKRLGSVVVLEKEASLGLHASGRNSGVIHSGINQKPETLKAKMCVEGNRLLREHCIKKGVPMNQGGTLVVARDQKELTVIEELLDLGKQCGVEGLEILNQEGLQKKEPDALGDHALFSPNGATVDSAKLLESVAHDAEENGAKFIFNSKITKIQGHYAVSDSEKYYGEHIINCAGLYADKIAHSMGIGKSYFIVPFRGEYYEIEGPRVNSMIYQPPNLKFPFLSIHLTKETDGKILAGPSAVISLGRESYKKEINIIESVEMFLRKNFWRLIFDKNFLSVAADNFKTSLFKGCFLKEAAKLAKGFSFDSVKPAKAGIRAQLVSNEGKLVNDILIEKGQYSTHVLNAVSPGMTCSLAFAKHVVDQYL